MEDTEMRKVVFKVGAQRHLRASPTVSYDMSCISTKNKTI